VFPNFQTSQADREICRRRKFQVIRRRRSRRAGLALDRIPQTLSCTQRVGRQSIAIRARDCLGLQAKAKGRSVFAPASLNVIIPVKRRVETRRLAAEIGDRLRDEAHNELDRVRSNVQADFSRVNVV